MCTSDFRGFATWYVEDGWAYASVTIFRVNVHEISVCGSKGKELNVCLNVGTAAFNDAKPRIIETKENTKQ
jgi:hypothetical protein